jgi:hypothetical protein
MFARRRQMIAFGGLELRSYRRGWALLLSLICAFSIASGADLSQAVVRQKVNVVTVAPNLTAAVQPAAQGAVIHDENVVRTGVESRAELEFSDQIGPGRAAHGSYYRGHYWFYRIYLECADR